jgi:hypothetical protein
LGYFDLINSVDKWVVFDTAQYIRHGWVNRNRILHPKSGWQYIIVPLKKHSRNTPISEIEISRGMDWKSRILGQIMHYKKQAPLFEEMIGFVETCLSDGDTTLSRLNVSILGKVCERLEIQFDYNYFSEMDIELAPIEDPGDWALGISEAMGASEYVNPPGGMSLFDARKFADKGIKLTIREFKNFEYPCGRHKFIPGLSIIDVFMWNSLCKIKEYLDAKV